MRFKNLWIISLSIFFIVACGETRNEIQESALLGMLDRREYSELVSILTPRLQKGENKEWSVYLAEAHLGKAGFEFFEITKRVLADQSPRAEEKNGLARVFPNCPPHAISPELQLSTRCLLARLMRHFPSSKNQDMMKALQILRETYPHPKQAPHKVKVLLVFVSLSNALARMGQMILDYDRTSPKQWNEIKLNQFFSEMGIFAEDAQRVLEWIPHTHDQVLGLISRGGEKSFFVREGKLIAFAQETGLPLLIRLAREPSNGIETAVLQSEVIQVFDQLIESFRK